MSVALRTERRGCKPLEILDYNLVPFMQAAVMGANCQRVRMSSRAA